MKFVLGEEEDEFILSLSRGNSISDDIGIKATNSKGESQIIGFFNNQGLTLCRLRKDFGIDLGSNALGYGYIRNPHFGS